MEKVICSSIETPIGPLLVARGPAGIVAIQFPEGKRPAVTQPDWVRQDHAFDDIRLQMNEYFSGRRRSFDLPLAPRGPPFQLDVWRSLRAIPYGETRSYAQIAAAIGRPAAVRAVGAANGSNPLPIVVPCHRVIGANGSLTGFGGGLAAKKFLLDLETYAARI
jgi:methylated-DNA-[protein]-cysteine S-methyltransferase